MLKLTIQEYQGFKTIIGELLSKIETSETTLALSATLTQLYDTLDNALADLKAGRVDYVSESSTSLAPFLQSNPDFTTKATWPLDPIFGNGVGGGVRKDDTELKAKLNAGIANVVKNGKYDEFLAKYPGLADQIQKPQS